MTPQLLGVIIGGVLPAVLFAGVGVATKASQQAGISMGMFLIMVSVALFCSGLGVILFTSDRAVTVKSATWALSLGVMWAGAALLILIAMSHFGAPMSKLVPLHNIAPLLAIPLMFLIFAEWRQVNVPLLLMGALLIVVGSILVVRS